MFDFGVGYSEIFVLAVLAVIVIGPKDLPKVLRTFGQFMNKARGMAREFQGHVDAAMKDSGVADIRKDINEAKGAISSVMGAPPSMLSPLETVAKSAPAKSFETYFGAEPAAGETRVAGQVVDVAKATT
jgi:sec-independent protein translocase protein TatB